jgi:HK97 family phage portal protein
VSLIGVLRGAMEAKAAVTLDSLPWWPMGGQDSLAGRAVNRTTALQVTAVLACCIVLAQGVAQVPFKLKRMRKDGKGADDATDHPLFRILNRRPNSFQTSFEFRETLMLHLALCQNAFVYISRVGGRIFELIPIEPGRVTVTQGNDLSLVYSITGVDNRTRAFSQKDIWHLRGMSWNGWMGLETIRLAREAIGLSLALEEAHSLLHANGVQPSGTYSVDGTLEEGSMRKLAGWIKANAAAGNRGNPLILDNGAKWLQQQMTGVDSQHLETRRYQVEDICRAFNVKPIMIGQADKAATYASAEQMFLAHVVHTLGPWYERWEQSADVNLLLDDEPDLFCEFTVQGLMRGDYKSRQEGLNIQRRAGVINADEWRALEGMNPREDGLGGQYIIEQNMGPQSAKPPEPGSSANQQGN